MTSITYRDPIFDHIGVISPAGRPPMTFRNISSDDSRSSPEEQIAQKAATVKRHPSKKIKDTVQKGRAEPRESKFQKQSVREVMRRHAPSANTPPMEHDSPVEPDEMDFSEIRTAQKSFDMTKSRVETSFEQGKVSTGLQMPYDKLARLPTEFGQLYFDEDENRRRFSAALRKEHDRIHEILHDFVGNIMRKCEQIEKSCEGIILEQMRDFDKLYLEFKDRVSDQYEFDQVAEREHFASPVDLMAERAIYKGLSSEKRIENLRELEKQYKNRVTEMNMALFDEYLAQVGIVANQIKKKFAEAVFDPSQLRGDLNDIQILMDEKLFKDGIEKKLLNFNSKKLEIIAKSAQKTFKNSAPPMSIGNTPQIMHEIRSLSPSANKIISNEADTSSFQ